jgi:hypothetical protein
MPARAARRCAQAVLPVLSRLLCALLMLGPLPAQAWFDRAHAAVGVLAMEQVHSDTRQQLHSLLGSSDNAAVIEACTWPDLYNKEAGGKWSVPLHYVNLDLQASQYRRSRDCPDGACLPEAIARYAERLADATLEPREQWEAFAFVCHLVADLHQPLHVAYADDKGGNLVQLDYQGTRPSLHVFWDGVLIEQKTDSWVQLAAMLRARPQPRRPAGWQAADITAWTNESFSFTRNFAYPRSHRVDQQFVERAWLVVLQQLDMAAGRLASVLDSAMQAREASAPAGATGREPPESPAVEPSG